MLGPIILRSVCDLPLYPENEAVDCFELRQLGTYVLKGADGIDIESGL